jgi:hypothetical protein
LGADVRFGSKADIVLPYPTTWSVNANIHYQPFPESVSEEHEIHTNYNGCHRHDVKHYSYPIAHFSTTSFHFLRSGRVNER